MTGLERLQARQRAAERLSQLFHAEARGLIHAQFFAEPVSYSHDAEEEAAFLRGFRDGREILTVHGEGRTA